MAIYYDGYDWDIDDFPGEYVYGDREYIDDYYMDERWKRIWDAPDYWVSTKARSAKGWIFEELNIEEDVDEHFY